MRKIHYLFLITIIYVVLLCNGCEKDSGKDTPADPKDTIELPHVSTLVVGNITPTSATSGGNVPYDGRSPVTSKGICYSTNPNPTISDNKTMDGTGIGSYSSVLTGLTINTTYYVRAYATNIKGTAYGAQATFKTQNAIPDSIEYYLNHNLNYGSVTDIEGYKYATIQIGTQTWLAENLKVTKYNDGTPIPNVIDNNEWANLTTGAWAYFKNDSSYSKLYGKLYNWHAVNTGKLCPSGWHIPTDTEWATLIAFLEPMPGNKLKSTGVRQLYTGQWFMTADTNPIYATNESGFTGFPGGYRANDGNYFNVWSDGYWWSATERPNSNLAWFMKLSYNNYNAGRDSNTKVDGRSCRCVAD